MQQKKHKKNQTIKSGPSYRCFTNYETIDLYINFDKMQEFLFTNTMKYGNYKKN